MLIKKENSTKHENSPECVVYEYPSMDKDLNVAFVELKGRYPASGYVFNELVKENFFVASGEGRVVIEEKEYKLSKRDAILIQPKQKFFIEGDLELIVSCSPAWYPEQHKHTDEHALSDS